jgi:hypothetical protein
MTRTDRLVVDALASGAMTSRAITEYVARRKRTSRVAIYWSLIRLESHRVIESDFVDGPYPRTRQFWLSESVAADAQLPGESTVEDVAAIVVGFVLALAAAYAWFHWR